MVNSIANTSSKIHTKEFGEVRQKFADDVELLTEEKIKEEIEEEQTNGDNDG